MLTDTDRRCHELALRAQMRARYYASLTNSVGEQARWFIGYAAREIIALRAAELAQAVTP